MFLSKNRWRSAKKVSKVEKQQDMELSTKQCKQKIISKSSSIAGSEARRLNSEQRSGPNQNKSGTNPVKQCDHTEAISSNVVESKASEDISNLNCEISCEENVNRRTYSLEKVSRSLDEVMASGKAILDALASVKATQFQSTQENISASAKSCSDLRKRGTYSLEEISDLLDASVNNNSVLEGNLNDLSQDACKGDVSNTNIKRGTYDLNKVSTKLDHSSEQNSSVEEVLHELSINRTQDNSCSSAKFKRGTYDLEKVEAVLDGTLNSDKNPASTTFNENKSGTYDLSDLPGQIDANSTPSGSEQNTGIEQSGPGRRGTYNLSDVSDLLDDTANSRKSIGESLDQISSMEMKRNTYDLSESNLDLPDQNIVDCDSDRANENTQMNLDKSHHDDESTDCASNSEKRRTYVLDGSNEFHGSDNGTRPVDGMLAELGLDGEDGRRVTELTPGEWMEQMKGLKTALPPSAALALSATVPLSAASPSSTAPPSSAIPTLLPLKLTLAPKKTNVTRENMDAKSSKNVFNVKKQRSQTIAKASSSTELNLLPDSETRARSMSDSKVKTQLKSHSSPNVASNAPCTNGFPRSESLKEISPGIQNYLAINLGLSNEQCMAVQRRLSSGSTTDDSKLANRKTYSLDDVAHSLDIATSQGLAMTKVLGNLDANTSNTHDETNLVDEKEGRSNTNVNSSENQPVLSTTDPKPESLDLESESTVLTNRKTDIVANGSSFVESPTGKSPTIDNQFKLVRKKAVYKPSARLQSFAHLLGGKGNQAPLRQLQGRTDPLKRNTYTLESVAESLEKAQDAGVPMLDALKRLSGSCQSDPSELSNEKRKTYDLEDLSNTLETAAATGVPIADTLRTIADPDTDDVFRAEKQDEVVSAKPKPPQPKKKPPPKPKRTFSNTSNPKVKFVSDSFVIEYYPSPPKRTQSDSSVRSETPKRQGNYVNICINENTLHDVIDGTSVSSSDKSESLKDKNEMPANKVQSPKRPDGKKPTTEVVSDLDSLLLKLAAEVQKPKNPDSSNNETERRLKSSTSNTKLELSSTKTANLSTKPNISNTKPDILNTKPDILNTKPDILNTKPDILNPKPDILNTNTNFSSTNRDVSSTKLDDEGYCSLSRKPGARLMKMRDESSNDLFKKEKLLTTFEKDTDMTDCKVEILRSFDNEGREIQEGVVELTAEHDTEDESADSDSGDSPQGDLVSRELNLLRLRLAEKQRDIEAQKQRTKEQQEEERKRFGQNVFWLAVGKGREKKDGVEIISPTKKLSQSANIKPCTNHFGNDGMKMEPSNSNKFATFTKQSSLDEDLPPSMGKLQDRTYDIKNKGLSLPEGKELSNKYCEDGNPLLEDRKASLEDRNSSEDVVQFRLSRQPPGTQGQSQGQISPENLESQNSEKARTPVLNYKSRMNVPVSFPNKLISENNQDTVHANNSEIIADGYKQEHLNSENEAQLATSPQRKCWNTEEAISSEPCIAVSESNYHIFDQKYEQMARSVETPERTGVTNNEIKDGLVVNTWNHNRVGSDSSGHGDDGDMDDLKKSPDESDGSLPGEDETPKKGLALFIGEENTVRNDDGLTPEQLRKREKFLRNRQQKIEEDKMKKEALLEKKRRKEEKMREIQLHREQEEQDRQAKLQEKREQAELAKQERQKYEIKRKENLTRMNFNDSTLKGNSGYSRIAMNTPDRIPGGNVGYNRTGLDTQDGMSGSNERYARSNVKTPTTAGSVFEGHRPAQSTTPSAFSGFTGVQSYVKPSGKTNRKLIINAISYVCLPGTVNKETKEKCLQAMTESSAQHFLILFKEGLKFRALYSLDLESNQVLKVFGIGPRAVTEKMIDQLFKYNSGGKDFSKIPAKGFSLSVDGFTLQKSCWQSNKPPVQSKTASNFKPSLYRSTR